MKPVNSLIRALPLVLTTLSAVGTAASVVLAVRATPRALELIEEESRRKHDGVPYAATKPEAAKACWRCYIPAAAVGISAIVCMFGAAALSRRQQAALAGAYALLDNSYKAYRGKLRELYGAEAHRKIVSELAAERAKGEPICAPSLTGCSCLDFAEADEEERLFYDSFSERYFQSTISRVLQAEYHLNRNFTLGAIPSLNDFYTFLGLEHTAFGDSVGWSNADGSYYWIDFNHYRTTVDGTMDCWVIEAVYAPDVTFRDDL